MRGGGKCEEEETGSCDLSDVDERFKRVLERVTQLLVPVKRLHTHTHLQHTHTHAIVSTYEHLQAASSSLANLR